MKHELINKIIKFKWWLARKLVGSKVVGRTKIQKVFFKRIVDGKVVNKASKYCKCPICNMTITLE